MAYKDKEARREYMRQYWQKNKERLLQQGRARNKEWYRNVGKELRKNEEHVEKRKISDRKYHKQVRLPRMRKRWIEVVGLLGGQCKHCRMTGEPIVFDCHHRDPSTKKFGIASNIRNKKWSEIYNEVQKCDLLCARCHRKCHVSAESHRHKIRQRIVDYFGGVCSGCGLKDDASIYDCHHVNPQEKEIRIAKLIRMTEKWDKIVKELKKCVLLCCICHRKLHAEKLARAWL